MLYRFHRERILIVVLLSISFIASLIKYHSKSLFYKANDLNGGEAITSSSSSQTTIEEYAEINGRKFKKIDWHDYAFINSEYMRNGTVV